jgi:hypothetical protein
MSATVMELITTKFAHPLVGFSIRLSNYSKCAPEPARGGTGLFFFAYSKEEVRIQLLLLDNYIITSCLYQVAANFCLDAVVSMVQVSMYREIQNESAGKVISSF